MPSMIEPFIAKMERAGVNAVAIGMFRYYFEKLLEGDAGLVCGKDITPISAQNLIFYRDLLASRAGDLSRLVMIKLNGGLGTSMGLAQAKSLLPVKEGLTFLDVIAQQSLLSGFPLVLMNSFNTHDDTMKFLQEHYPAILRGSMDWAFVQNQVPRIQVNEDSAQPFMPLQLDDEQANWNPPGHGDLYPALYASGLLDRLLDAGHDIAFVSNSDNLGAFVDERILSKMCSQGEALPFLMEVRERTPMDKKGGHLAKRNADGQLILREIAQCPKEEEKDFQDIGKFSYFNTNNLWINLRALKKELEREGDGFLKLPLIQNTKNVKGHEVIQIETAMGAAIELFQGAKALVVPRSRYAPVKTTNHLLVVRSDAYRLDPRNRKLLLSPPLTEPPEVELSDDYKTVDKLDAAFPATPSIRECEKLEVTVPATFDVGVVFRGKVTIDQPGHYPAGVYGETQDQK